MSKTRAFLLHFSISAAVVGAALAVILVFWYPAPYFEILGTWTVVRILIGITLVVGPLLTLLLFRSGKPGLMLDMSVVAAIQLGALVYGMFILFQERPYYVVFAVDRFEVHARRDVDETRITDERLTAKSWRQPIYAVANLPGSLDAQQQLIDDVLSGKPDIDRRPEFWSLYEENSGQVLAAATPLAKFGRQRPDAAVFTNRISASHRNGDTLVGLPVIGKTAAYVIVLEPEHLKPVDLIPVSPWVSPDTSETDG